MAGTKTGESNWSKNNKYFLNLKRNTLIIRSVEKNEDDSDTIAVDFFREYKTSILL